MNAEKLFGKAFNLLLSNKVKERGERLILSISIISYLVHLFVIFLVDQGWLQINSSFFSDPISAIYTPFSFILIYEVYLLIFFLPKSISSYIGKQYEIITLIVIRRIFKDIASLDLSGNWFQNQDDIQFTYDVLTSLLLFALIFFYYKMIPSKSGDTTESEQEDKMLTFIQLKKGLATLLVPIFVGMALYSLISWSIAALSDYQNGVLAFKHINNIFFDEFFTVLIIVDVLLLLASFFYSDQFHKIIRNSGFVISTVLIKMSFSVGGIVNNALIVGAVLFGLLILLIHNLFEKENEVDPGPV